MWFKKHISEANTATDHAEGLRTYSCMWVIILCLIFLVVYSITYVCQTDGDCYMCNARTNELVETSTLFSGIACTWHVVLRTAYFCGVPLAWETSVFPWQVFQFLHSNRLYIAELSCKEEIFHVKCLTQPTYCWGFFYNNLHARRKKIRKLALFLFINTGVPPHPLIQRPRFQLYKVYRGPKKFEN
jgi:hypothetical protein